MKPGATHSMFHFPEDGGEDGQRSLSSCKANLTEARTIVTDEGGFVHRAVVTWTHLQGETTSSLISSSMDSVYLEQSRPEQEPLCRCCLVTESFKQLRAPSHPAGLSVSWAVALCLCLLQMLPPKQVKHLQKVVLGVLRPQICHKKTTPVCV